MGVFETADWWTGEAGDVFQMDAGQEVSSVTAAVIRLRDPDGVVVAKTATQQASSRYWGFTVATSDFTKRGPWRAQLILTRTASPKISLIWEFKVGGTMAVS